MRVFLLGLIFCLLIAVPASASTPGVNALIAPIESYQQQGNALADNPASPDQVVKSFVSSLNRKKPVCSSMIAERRLLYAVTGSVFWPVFKDRDGKWRDLDLSESWTDQVKTDMCDQFINSYRGYVEDAGMPAWKKTTVKTGRPQIRGDKAYVKARLNNRFEAKGDSFSMDANLFLLKSQGRWLLALPDDILDLTKRKRSRMPKSLKQWSRVEALIKREADELQAFLDKRFADRAAATSDIKDSLSSCSGSSSGGQDRAGDVFWSSGGDPIEDQSLAASDIEQARLYTSSGSTICLRLTLKRALPQGGGFGLEFFDTSDNHESLGGLSVSLRDGKAVSYLDFNDGKGMLPAATSAGVSGNQISVVLKGDLAARMLSRRSFLWWLKVFEDNPAAQDPYSDFGSWMDEFPNINTVADGVLHQQ